MDSYTTFIKTHADTLAALFYAEVHKSLPLSFNAGTVKSLLEALPPGSGPRANLPIESGWQHDNRWVRCTASPTRPPGELNQEYNGLDWLLLHNFNQLVYFGP